MVCFACFTGEPVALGDPVHEPLVGLGLDPAGADRVDPDAARRELVGESLAVGAQRGLRGCVRQGRVVLRQFTLDRGEVQHHARPGLDHRREQSSIEPHRSEEVEVQLGQPLLVGDDREPTGRRRGTSDDVHQDVECAAGLGDPGGHGVGAFDRRRVRLDEAVGVLVPVGHRSGRHVDVGAHLPQSFDDGLARALRPARDQRPATVETIAI